MINHDDDTVLPNKQLTLPDSFDRSARSEVFLSSFYTSSLLITLYVST